MVASASLQSSAAAVAVASSPSHQPRHRHSNLLPSLPSTVTFAPPSILNSSSRLTLRYRKQQRWLHDSTIGKAQESTRLYSLWRQVTCKIDKALLPEFSSGQLKCFSCLKRARGHGFCVKSHASNIFKDKSTFPMQSHSFGSSIVKRIIAPQATLGPDEPHVASTSWPDIALEKQRLGFWDPEAEKAELQRFLNSELPSHPKLQQGQLKNGLRYIILPNKLPANRFEAHMEVHVGSIDEEDDEQGIAHMIEHVAFLGSKKREKLLGTGARSNAYTDFHHTVFHIHSPTSAKDSDGDLLPFVLDALNELLQHLHSENKLSKRFPIGLEEQIKQLDAEKIRKFHERWYFPANATLYLVGDIDNIQKTVCQIEAVFGRAVPEDETPIVHRTSAFGAMTSFLVPKLPSGLIGSLTNDKSSISVDQSRPVKKERQTIRPPVEHI